jgi:hypothetical protein
VKTYVTVTGGLFGLLTLIHVWRMVQEGRSVATDPWYILVTAIAAALSIWAWRLIRTAPRS